MWSASLNLPKSSYLRRPMYLLHHHQPRRRPKNRVQKLKLPWLLELLPLLLLLVAAASEASLRHQISRPCFLLLLHPPTTAQILLPFFFFQIRIPNSRHNHPSTTHKHTDTAANPGKRTKGSPSVVVEQKRGEESPKLRPFVFLTHSLLFIRSSCQSANHPPTHRPFITPPPSFSSSRLSTPSTSSSSSAPPSVAFSFLPLLLRLH